MTPGESKRPVGINQVLNFGNLLHLLQDEERKVVRNIESLEKKLINNKFAVIFNEMCIKENLLPTYSEIYIYIYI